ncbi:hypothetical protein BDC45DRAFT_561373 [Circinella umbellata]|nr:hypothetical protein BDC45DRAFT_561373 [Circinella umbellata]
MNPTNQQSVPTDPYLDLLLEIRDSISQLRNDVVEIKQCVAAVEEHLRNNPQQQQQQQQQQQSLGTVAMPLATYRTEEQREQLFREYMSLNYQPPPGAPDLTSTGTIERYGNGKDKKAVLTFLKVNGNIGEESVNSMYESLLKESRTHKRDLECALDQFPSVATYKDFPSQVKRMEIKKFEDNIKRMYKLPIDKYLIQMTLQVLLLVLGQQYMSRSRMGLSSQRGASPTPTLRTQGSLMSMTSDHTESNTQDQMPPPPPISPSAPSPSPSSSTIQQLRFLMPITHELEQPPLTTSPSTYSAPAPATAPTTAPAPAPALSPIPALSPSPA